jgi:pteridine reductase
MGLAEAGYDMVIGYRSSAEAATNVVAEVRAAGRHCRAISADLTDSAAAVTLVEAVRDAYGRLDLIVNSAASFRSVPLLSVDAEEWDAVMTLNVRAPHLVVRAAAALLRESRGSVVNIADLSAFQAWTDYPHHAVSKAALVHLTKVQARTLAPDVRVNAVAPGAVLPPEEWEHERLHALAEVTPLKRLGTADDVVQAVLYLAQADFVTGQVLVVDGGRLLGPAGPPRPLDGDHRD